MDPTALTETSATLQAQIDPEGSETTWQIYLECSHSSAPESPPCEPLSGGPQLHEGKIAGGAAPEVVQAVVSGLRPGYVYKYTVVAENSLGKEGWEGMEFGTCPSLGSCPKGQSPGLSWWTVEDAIRSGEEEPKREAEREAKIRSEEEERTAHERAIREAGERAGEAAERARLARSLECVVPKLKGDSLTSARKALRKAHCKLGKIHLSSEHDGRLVVTSQSAGASRRLAKDTAVAVTIGSPPRTAGRR